MHIFDDVLDPTLIDSYRNRVATHFDAMIAKNHPYMAFYPTRNVVLKLDDPVISIIQQFLESRLRVKLTCYEAELQTWPVRSYSQLHVHDNPGRRKGDYNSSLYLNDNFFAGEFYTEHGIVITPKKNRLTFFDGSKIKHGVHPVERCHRYTMIFWFRDTVFY